MITDLVVVGAGGFGREALDVVEAINAAASTPVFEVVGVIDSSPSARNLERLKARNVAWLGDIDQLSKLHSTTKFIVAIGNPAVREKVATQIGDLGLVAVTVIHPSAQIGSAFEVGAGSVICGGVHVSTNVRLGRHVHINPNVTIGHDTTMADYVSINPAAVISGDVEIEAGVLVGAGAVVLQGIRIGSDALVGASACVVRDVATGVVVKGVPAA